MKKQQQSSHQWQQQQQDPIVSTFWNAHGAATAVITLFAQMLSSPPLVRLPAQAALLKCQSINSIALHALMPKSNPASCPSALTHLCQSSCSCPSFHTTAPQPPDTLPPCSPFPSKS
jgi:hypothetical protein